MPRPDPKGGPDMVRFVPRLTLILLLGFVVSIGAMWLYVLPVLNQAPPPGAVPEWQDEQIKQRLRGKVHWFLLGSYGAVAALGISWMNRRSRGRR
jgi:hypothetical protein